MGTTIVQSAYQKSLELHDFVPIFLKNFLGEDPQTPPPSSGYILGYVLINKCFVLFFVFLAKLSPPPPFLLKSKKKKKKKNGPPLF